MPIRKPKEAVVELTGKRGWFWPLNSNKAHFFTEENGGRAICNTFLMFSVNAILAEAEDFGHESIDNCASCKRKRLAMIKQGLLPADPAKADEKKESKA